MTEPRRKRSVLLWGGCFATLLAVAAAMSFRSAVEHPDPPSVDLSAVEPAVATGLTDARQAVIDSPDSADCWSQLAMTYDAHEYTHEALACYEIAAQLAPRDARWPYLTGTLHYATDRGAARHAFQRACDIAPQSPLYQIRLAEVLLDTADLTQAEQHLQAALAIDGSNARGQFRLAQLKLLAGDSAEALRLAELALTGRPRHRAILQFLITVHGRLGTQSSVSARNCQAQLQDASTLTDGWPDPVRSQVQLFRLDSWWLAGQGEDRLQAGDADGSIALLREALTRSPSNAVFRVRLANAYLQSGQLDEAKRVIGEAPGEQASNFDLLRMNGTIAIFAEDWPAAVENLRMAVQQKPDSAALLADFGFALRQAGKLSEAAEVLDRSVRLDPQSSATWKQLVEILVEARDHEEAKLVVERGLEYLPDDSAMRALKQKLSE